MLRRSYKTMNFLHRLARRAWPARKAGEEQGAKFVSGLEEAFARARDAAGVRNSEIFGATSRVGAWTPGLIDEVVNHLAPVLLGDSSRLYRTPAAPLLALERTLLEQSRGSRSAITSTCRTGRSPRRSLQRSESVVVHAYRDVRETGEVDVEVEQARNGRRLSCESSTRPRLGPAPRQPRPGARIADPREGRRRGQLALRERGGTEVAMRFSL
jgi:hypothetical protein